MSDEQHEGDSILHQDAVEEVVRDVLNEFSASGILFHTASISAAQLATFNSVAVEVVPAPGEGFVLVPVSLFVRYVAGVTPFDTTTDIEITWDGGLDSMMSVTSIGTDEATSQVGIGASKKFTASLADAENLAITTFPNSASDLALGDGSLLVTVGYHLHSVV